MVAGRLTLVAFLTLLVQVVLVSPIHVAGAQANVVLLLAIVTAMETDAERGALVGFAVGLAFDLLLDTPAGLSALTFALTGWVVGRLKDSVLRSSAVISALLVVGASAGATLFYAGVAGVLGVTVDAGELPAIVAVVAVVNAVLARPMRWAVRWALGPESRSPSRDRSIFRA